MDTIRFEKLEERVRLIEQNKNLQEYQFNQIMETLAIMQNDIKELKEKPAKRWDLVITGLITSTITMVMAYIMKRG